MEKSTVYTAPAAQNDHKPVQPVPTQQPVKKTLDKYATELNYLFERYWEDPTKVTLISMEAVHYDYLKKGGFIEFTAEEVDWIKKRALTQSPAAATDQNKLNQLMKKIGVLKYFDKQIAKGIKILFHVD
jgi:hypothetical protein